MLLVVPYLSTPLYFGLVSSFLQSGLNENGQEGERGRANNGSADSLYVFAFSADHSRPSGGDKANMKMKNYLHDVQRHEDFHKER